MTAILPVAVPVESPNEYHVAVGMYYEHPFSFYVNVVLLEQQLRATLPEIYLVNNGFVDIGDPAVRYHIMIIVFTAPVAQPQRNTVDAVILAHDPNVLTPEQQAAAYLAENLEFKQVFIDAANALEVGIANFPGTPTLPDYRTLLGNIVQSLAPLAGTRFETHFNRERTAQSLSMAVTSMTLAQCAQFDNLLHVWLTARKVDVIMATFSITSSLTQG